MKIYMVGGAVRDRLLGLPIKDRDWVVVGATPQDLLQAGYMPVGKDFPVFLHPQTREEVALARTERKTAPGYQGFAFHADASVTLEEDLARRDLTINAIAQDEQGHLIDPYGGQKDLQAKILRHVTHAFAEDPVRILRVARFAARYQGFTLAPETLQLMRQMVDNGEVDALVAERVWQELSRGLMEANPPRMVDVLRQCGALAHILPEIEQLFGQLQSIPKNILTNKPPQHPPLGTVHVDAGQHSLHTLNQCAAAQAPLSVRFALWVNPINSPEQILALCERLRVPTHCRDLALLTHRELPHLHHATHMDAAQVMHMFMRCDAFRQPERFRELLLAAAIDAQAYLIDPAEIDIAYPQKNGLDQALIAALATDTKTIARQALASGKQGTQIGEAIDAARLLQVQEVWTRLALDT